MTDLVPYEPSPTQSALALVDDGFALAQRMAGTTFVPKEYRNKPEELLAAILTGHELGIGPMAAMSKIHNIQGRAGLSAELMRALPLQHGHSIWVEEASSEKVVLAGHRRGEPEKVTRITWTMAMAKAAGLASKQVWRQFPQAMLLARCSGDLCRAIFADCLSGISYTEEELQDGYFIDEGMYLEVEADGTPDGVAPAPVKDNRRRAPAKKAAAKKAVRPPEPPAEPVDALDEIDELDAMGTEEEPPAKSTETTRAQLVVIRTEEALGKIDREERLAFYAASIGRKVASTKDLTPEDVDAVLVDLDLVKAGEKVWEGGRLDEYADVVNDGAPAPAAAPAEGSSSPGRPGSEEEWRAFLEQQGVKVAFALREARKLAKAMGEAQPASFEEFVACENVSLLDLVQSAVIEKAEDDG